MELYTYEQVFQAKESYQGWLYHFDEVTLVGVGKDEKYGDYCVTVSTYQDLTKEQKEDIVERLGVPVKFKNIGYPPMYC